MPDLAGARALVTGASGFIGASLTRALLAVDVEVHALVRSGGVDAVPAEAVVYRADLRDPDALARAVASARPEVVFHLAAGPGHPADAAGRAAMIQDTVVGTANLLDALRPLGPRLVHVGGALEYGHSRSPLKESDALAPVTFRGAAKGAATLLALEHAYATGAPVTVLRPFAVYGPWERPPRFVPAIVTAALRGEPIPVTAGGAGRDYVFVGDVVDACLLAAVSPRPAGDGLQRRHRAADDERGARRQPGGRVGPRARRAPRSARAETVGRGHVGRRRDEGRRGARLAAGARPPLGAAETVAWFAEREAPVAGAAR